jgi:pyruvate dehydrogenase E2 component (dihydrolipoamide acetyltransferase)
LADVTMPQLGETVTEGTITRWMKSVGDQVERDEPLFEVSTDKVDTEVPSPASGVLTEIVVPEGETVDVGVRLAVIGDGRAAPSTESSAPSEEATLSAAATVPPQQQAPPPAPQQQAPPPPPEQQAPPPPQAPQPAPPPQQAPPPPPPGFATGPGIPDGTPEADAMLLSPMVRRLLAENGINAGQVRGTGLGGRITREDVLDFIDAQHAGRSEPAMPAVSATPERPGPQPAAQAVAPAPATTATSALVPRAGDRVVPFSNVRRRTAEHMVRSKATSAHAFIAAETDFENVERVRRAFGSRFRDEEGFSLTYLPFVARAAVEALREYPNLNASVSEDSLIVHSEINLGIAVDLAHEGLIVPVVHRAEEVTLRGIARRVHDLAGRARSRQLTADDISGGTFSITNDGPFGTYFTVPIINQPQVAILATDGIKRRPVVVTAEDGSESIAIHSVGVLGMSWDHRAVDGAYVSEYLRQVGEILTTRDWAAEL